MPALLSFPRSALLLALLAGGLACTQAPRPTLSLHLVAVPADFEEVNVHIREVQLEGSSGWTTIAVPNVTLNLVRLTGGVAAELVERTAIPVGSYPRLRLVLGSAGSVRLRDGRLHVLALPASLDRGLVLPLGLEAQPGTAQSLVVEVDAAKSVRRYPVLGGGVMFVLQPQIRSIDQLARGDRAGEAAEDG